MAYLKYKFSCYLCSQRSLRKMYFGNYDTSSKKIQFCFPKKCVCLVFHHSLRVVPSAFLHSLRSLIKKKSFSLPTKTDTFWFIFLFFFCIGCIPLDNTLGNGTALRNDTTDGGIIYEFHCHPGFLLNGSSVISCFQGQWNDSKPSCRQTGEIRYLLNLLCEFSKTFHCYRFYCLVLGVHLRICNVAPHSLQ